MTFISKHFLSSNWHFYKNRFSGIFDFDIKPGIWFRNFTVNVLPYLKVLYSVDVTPSCMFIIKFKI